MLRLIAAAESPGTPVRHLAELARVVSAKLDLAPPLVRIQVIHLAAQADPDQDFVAASHLLDPLVESLRSGYDGLCLWPLVSSHLARAVQLSSEAWWLIRRQRTEAAAEPMAEPLQEFASLELEWLQEHHEAGFWGWYAVDSLLAVANPIIRGSLALQSENRVLIHPLEELEHVNAEAADLLRLLRPVPVAA